ncbi:MAG: hypothetical protein GYB65_05715 [Chloroflexi bacterium]|nr:hypothetical protein [Chloroflexota bacterium]
MTQTGVGITDTFDAETLHAHWKPLTIGSGALEYVDQTLRCVLPPTDDTTYSDAQISDYQGLPRRDFPWHPPLRLTVRAWASQSGDQLRGTAGFGFWNEPFVPLQRGVPRLPRAIWFFAASPPNNMALSRDVPGYGWKAAQIDATRLPFFALLPLAPVGFLLMRIPALYRRLWPVGQWALGVSETELPASLAQPHTYELDWLVDGAVFRVDGQVVHTTTRSPKGPLGFIAWIDNQYAVVTPQGRFRFGLLNVDKQQWLALDRVEIQPLREL